MVVLLRICVTPLTLRARSHASGAMPHTSGHQPERASVRFAENYAHRTLARSGSSVGGTSLAALATDTTPPA